MKTILRMKNTVARLLFIILLSFTFFTPLSKSQTLVGWWKMDEGSGTTLVDASTYGNDGTLINSPTWVSGVIDSALNLNGSDQYATVADDDTTLDITDGITLTAWVKPNLTGSTQYIMKKAYTDDTFSNNIDGYELAISSGGVAFVRFNQFTSGGNMYRLDSSPITIDGNTWTHVAATYDGSTIRMYINGEPDGSLSGPSAILTNDLLLEIGAQDGNSKGRFSGAIDDARVYDGALDNTEISTLATVFPTAPILRAPSDLSTGLTIPVRLRWYAAASAESYQLQISEVSNFATTVYSQSGLTVLSTLLSTLPENTQLYWRVRATNTVDTSAWSEVWTFTTSVVIPSLVSAGSGFALNLNGNNYVLVDDDGTSPLDLDDAITIEAWFYAEGQNSQRIVYKLNGGGTAGYELFLGSGGDISFRINGSDSYRIYSTTTSYSYPTKEWVYAAATFDGTTMKLFVNGNQEGGDLIPGETIGTNNGELGIGSNGSGGSRFTGVIDEVRLWDIARSENDIRNNMCKKLNGNESGLIGYWRFDETIGSSFSDETSNSLTGTIYEEAGTEHVWSGANIGDESVNDYDATGGYTVKVYQSNGDSLIATTSSGTVYGIQAYRVDDVSMRAGATEDSSWTVDPLRYWGVKVIGTGSPTYGIVYNYTNHPGVFNEANLRLVKRDNISDASWSKVTATLDTVNNTLTSTTDQTGTEYALASTSDALPVELSSFSAIISKDKYAVSLKWRTETEVSNYGFEVQRSAKNDKWDVLGFVEGHGNSNSPKDYSFLDENVAAMKYSYRLKQIDTDGSFDYSKIIEVEFGSPFKFELSQNYPNPFNPVTTIRFSIPQSGNIKLTVYNVLGEQIAQLVNGFREAGVHTINFDATAFNSGLYIYKIESNGLVQSRKMLLIK